MVEWIYLDHGRKHGPISGEQLRLLAGQSKVLPSTPIRRVDGINVSPWRRAGELKGLFTVDVSSQLGDPICGSCGERMVAGGCTKCSPTPPPPPPPILPAEPIVHPAAVAFADIEPEPEKELPLWRRQRQIATEDAGPGKVIIVGVRLPLGDMMNLIITFWVASFLLAVILWIVFMILAAVLTSLT